MIGRKGDNVAMLPSAGADPVRQPRGGAARAYRRANPWPGTPRILSEPAEAFERAWHAAEIATAVADLAASVARELRAFGTAAEGDRARDDYSRAIEEAHAARGRLAQTPATSANQLRRKVHGIGIGWLRGDAERAMRWRAAVEADAARLGVRCPIG